MASIQEDLSKTTYQFRPPLVQAVQFLGMSAYNSSKPVFKLFEAEYPNWLRQALQSGTIVWNGGEEIIAGALIVYPYEWLLFTGNYWNKLGEFEFEQQYVKAAPGQIAYLPVIDNELHNMYHINIKTIYDIPQGNTLE